MEELFKKGTIVVFVKKRRKQLVMRFKAVIVVVTLDGRIMGIINKVDVNRSNASMKAGNIFIAPADFKIFTIINVGIISKFKNVRVRNAEGEEKW